MTQVVPRAASPAYLFVCLFAAAAVAGCVGADETAPSGDGLADTADDARVSATTGSIRGTAASDLFEPLAGALVSLLESGQQTRVARNGEYVINDVAPGRYTVNFEAEGYDPLARSAVVEAGQVTRLDVQAAPLPGSDAYIRDYTFNGIINSYSWQIEPPGVGCIVAPEGVAKSCSGTGSGENTQLEVNITNSVETILVEMVWDASGPLGEHLQLDLICEDAPRGSGDSILDTSHPCYYKAPGSTAPLIIRADKQDSVEGEYKWTGNWDVRVFASHGLLGTHELTGIDVGVAYQQTFTIYLTLFHRAPAPDGYSGIPDR